MSAGRGTASWARACYGIDLTSQGPLIVRAERRRGAIAFTTNPNLDAPSETAANAVIVAGALAPTDSVIHRIRAPLAAARKARRVFPALLDIELPFPLEDCVHEFLDARRCADGGTETVAVVARRDSVGKKLASFKAAGWDPALLDVEGLALWTQSFEEIPSSAGAEVRVVAYAGHDRCVLVVGRGPNILGAHGLRAGPSMEMGRYLRAHFPSNNEPMRWCWCGPGAVDEADLQDLSRELSSAWNAQCQTHRDPAYFLARAIAGRALSAGPLRCNLRRGDLAHAVVRERARRRAASGAVGCLVAGLLLCAVNIGWRSVVAGREAALLQRFEDTAQSLVSYRMRARGADAIVQVRKAVDQRRAAMQTIVRLFEPSLINTLSKLASIAERGQVQCEVIALDERTAALTGSARSRQACEAIVGLLRSHGYEAGLRQDARLADGRVRFVIAATEQAP